MQPHVLYRWQPFRAFPGEWWLISPQDPVRRDTVQIVESVPYVFHGSGSTLRLKPEAEKLDLNFCIRTPSFFCLFLAWNDTLWLPTCQSWSFHLNPNSNLQIGCLCWENSSLIWSDSTVQAWNVSAELIKFPKIKLDNHLKILSELIISQPPEKLKNWSERLLIDVQTCVCAHVADVDSAFKKSTLLYIISVVSGSQIWYIITELWRGSLYSSSGASACWDLELWCKYLNIPRL